MTIIEFLNSTASDYLEDNDISVTKFLDAVLENYLEQNDISVTKFLDYDNASPKKAKKTRDQRDQERESRDQERKRREQVKKDKEEAAKKEEERLARIADEKRKQEEDFGFKKSKKRDTDEHRLQQHYDEELQHYDPSEYLPGHSQPDPYLAHSFDDTEAEFSRYDNYYTDLEHHSHDLFSYSDAIELENLDGTPLFLATAANKYLDTTVSRFLENDISVTKFL